VGDAGSDCLDEPHDHGAYQDPLRTVTMDARATGAFVDPVRHPDERRPCARYWDVNVAPRGTDENYKPNC
jgi:hypothetical protein